MRHPRIIIAGIGFAALAAIGGVTAASVSGSPANSPHSAGQSAAGQSAAAATVRTASVAVGGKSETILVNAQGLPLYLYLPDTATKSFVTGGLARLWPPLVSATPTAAGLSGKLTVLNDASGDQVAYNGHPLYTFASDHAGQVTGQGFQNFFVATPAIPAIAAGAPAPTGAVPAAPAAPGGGFGY